MSADPFAVEEQPIAEVVQMPVRGPDLPPGHAIQQTRSSYTTAVMVQKPRELARVERSLVDEATLMGESAFYGWGAGKDRIEGPSQCLAHTALRCWGNAALEFGPIQDLTDSWILTAYVIDLETGSTIARPFRMSKSWKVYGKHDAARKEDIRFQIGASKAGRNAILHFLPSWLIDRAMTAAKSGVRKRMTLFIEKKGIVAAQDLAVSELAKHGVTEEDVLRKFGIAERKALDVDRLVVLRGDLAALQNGEARAEDLFAKETTGRGASDIIAGAGKPAQEGTAAEGDPAASHQPPTDDQGALFEAKPDVRPNLTDAQIGDVKAALAKSKGGPSLGELEEYWGDALSKVQGEPGEEGASLFQRVVGSIGEMQKVKARGRK